MKNANKRVQRTRHKVSGPLTRDVGANEMIGKKTPARMNRLGSLM